MELTLRSARRLEQKINMKLLGEELGFTLSVRLLEDPKKIKTQVTKARKEILADIATREELLQLRFLIRTAISETNIKSKINQQITTREYLKQKLDFYTTYTYHVSLRDWAAVEDEIFIKRARLENTSDNSPFRGVSSTTGVTVITEKELKEFKSVIKEVNAQLQTIDDNLLILNSTNKITLTEDQAKLLQKVDLV